MIFFNTVSEHADDFVLAWHEFKFALQSSGLLHLLPFMEQPFLVPQCGMCQDGTRAAVHLEIMLKIMMPQQNK